MIPGRIMGDRLAVRSFELDKSNCLVWFSPGKWSLPLTMMKRLIITIARRAVS